MRIFFKAVYLFILLIDASVAFGQAGNEINISISTEPRGVLVFKNKDLIGKTPITLKVDLSSEHKIVLQKEGYWAREVEPVLNMRGRRKASFYYQMERIVSSAEYNNGFMDKNSDLQLREFILHFFIDLRRSITSKTSFNYFDTFKELLKDTCPSQIIDDNRIKEYVLNTKNAAELIGVVRAKCG